MKNLYLLLFVFIGATHLAKAQTANQYYFKSKTSVALEDMSSGTSQLIGANRDEVTSDLTNFFPFTFAGVSYNQFSVSEDGVIVLGASTYFPYPYDNYFTQTPAVYGQSPAYPIILLWGEDLFTADGGVTYKITGSSPSRKLIIEFKVNSYEDNSKTHNKTFQVWLFEGSNNIQLVYGDGVANWYNNGNIGMAASATDFLSVNSTSHTVSSTEVISNSGTYPGTGTWPGKGTSYLFSPTEIVEPAPIAPITATVSMIPEYPVEGQKRHTIYLGYGVQSVTLSTSNVSGGSPSSTGYSYSWSPSTGLSSTTVASPVASPKQTTKYTLTISDGKGNTATESITVNVIDARCLILVKICKDGKELCVTSGEVNRYLKSGATLGGCNTVSIKIEAEVNISATNKESNALSYADADAYSGLAIYPNPSFGVFNLQLPELTQQSYIIVFDASGRTVAQKAVNAKQRNVQMDLTNKAPGIYLIKLKTQERTWTSNIMIK